MEQTKERGKLDALPRTRSANEGHPAENDLPKVETDIEFLTRLHYRLPWRFSTDQSTNQSKYFNAFVVKNCVERFTWLQRTFTDLISEVSNNITNQKEKHCVRLLGIR